MPGDSKTEKATPKKRRDERKEGHVPISKDIVTVVSLLGTFFLLKALFPSISSVLMQFMKDYIAKAPLTVDLEAEGRHIFGDMALAVARGSLILLLFSVVLAVVATGVQTRFLFTGKNLRPKFSRLSPLKGIKNLFSIRSLVELLKNMVKITILIVILYLYIKDDMTAITRTLYMNLNHSIVYTLNEVMRMVLKISIIFVAIAAFDLFYQIWDYERQIKMSKQELKEEYKQTEGNPEIKGRIRDIQRQRARSRMMQAVPEADVIIRNPTHYAVALRYNTEKDNAPIVLAKGVDELALRIVKIGEEHGVHIMENKPLARGLYTSTNIGQEIPEEYYGVVAEILVYVYKINHKIMS